MRLIEATLDYARAIKDETLYGLGFIFSGLVIISIPMVTVLLLGIIFYLSFIAVGYFAFVSLLSPRTGEKILHRFLAPKIQEVVTDDKVIEE
jgi:hypothetical protein